MTLQLSQIVKQQILDQRAEFQSQLQDLNAYIKGQNQNLCNSSQQLASQQSMELLNFKSVFEPVSTIINPKSLTAATPYNFSCHPNSISRCQLQQSGFFQPNQRQVDPFFVQQTSKSENIKLNFQQKEVKQFPAKSKNQLQNPLKYPPGKTESDAQWNQLAKAARPADEDDIQPKPSNEFVNRYKIKGNKIIEEGPNKKQLYYGFGSCQAEGELFGISYMDIKQQEPRFYNRKPLISTKQVQENCRIVENVSNATTAAKQAQFLKTFPLKHIKTDFQLFDKLAAAQNLQFQDSVPQKMQKCIKDVLTKNKQKYASTAPKHPPGPRVQPPREKAYTETYDKKMIMGKDYVPNFDNIPAIKGFLPNATPQDTQQSLLVCPTLAHFIVCLCAHQQTNIKVRPEDALHSTGPLFMGRQSLVLRDIIIAIQSKYMKVRQLLMPEKLPALECLLTTLLLMTAPNDQLVEDARFINNNEISFKCITSPFDANGGTLEQKQQPIGFALPYPIPPIYKPTSETAVMSEAERLEKEGDKMVAQRKQQALAQAPIQIPGATVRIGGQQVYQNQPKPPVQDSGTAAKTQLLSQTARNFEEFRISGIFKYLDPAKAAALFNDGSRTFCNIQQRLTEFLQMPDQPFSLLISVDQLTIITESENGYVFDCIAISADEYQALEAKQLFLSEEEQEKLRIKQENQNKKDDQQDEDSDFIAEDLGDVEHSKTAVLDLVCPLLGEFSLVNSQQLDSNNCYFGVNLENLNKIAAVSIVQAMNDEEEVVTLRKRYDEGFFNQIAASAANSERLSYIQRQKQKTTLSLNAYQSFQFRYTALDKLNFRAQERLRYFLIPHVPFSFVVRGRKHFVGPAHRFEAKSQLYHQLEPRRVAPQFMTKINAVQDACARLPARFGTREDIVDRCSDSHFFNPADARLTAKVSCAMDRLRLNIYDKEKKLRAAAFSASDHIWYVTPARLLMLLDNQKVQEEWPKDVQDWYIRAIRVGGGLVGLGNGLQRSTMQQNSQHHNTRNSNLLTLQQLEAMVASGYPLSEQQKAAMSQMQQFQKMQQQQMLRIQAQQQANAALYKK